MARASHFRVLSFYPQVVSLVPLADSVRKLQGKCGTCEQRSMFTLRIVQGAHEAACSVRWLALCETSQCG